MMTFLRPKITFKYAVRKNVPNIIDTDCDRFQQILLLLVNFVIRKISSIRLLKIECKNLSHTKKEKGVSLRLNYVQEREPIESEIMSGS